MKLGFMDSKVYYKDKNNENDYMFKFLVLRAQFFLKMIYENPDKVLEYYRDINTWPLIDQNAENYYIEKKKMKQKNNRKVKRNIIIEKHIFL